MATSSRWVVLPAYPWSAVLKDALLVSKLKDLYNRPSRSMTVAAFPWPVRLLLGDQFSAPGREKSSRRQGTNILEMSSTVRDPKQAAVNVVILRCQECAQLSAGSTDQDDMRIVRSWLNSWMVHKSNSSKCELLYDEMLAKRTRESSIVRDRREVTERIVRESMGPDAAAATADPLEADVEPAVTTSASTPSRLAAIPKARPIAPLPPRRVLPIVKPSYGKQGYTSDEDDGDEEEERDGEGAAEIEENMVSTAIDELKIEDANLTRLAEVVDLEDKGSIHFSKDLAKFSKALLVMYLISALLCGISGDGWEIMINFFAAGVMGVWGMYVALHPGGLSLTLFTITAMLDGLFLYPLHVILRATIFDNDPEAYLNGNVIASVVLIELVLFLIVVYSVSFLGIAQRVSTTLKMLLPPPQVNVAKK